MDKIESAFAFFGTAFLLYFYYIISKDFLANLDKWRRAVCVLVIAAFIFYIDTTISNNTAKFYQEIKDMITGVREEYSYNEDLDWELNEIIEFMERE